MFDSGLFRRSPGNTKSFCRIAFRRFTTIDAAIDIGTSCGRPAFMRLAGTVHIFVFKIDLVPTRTKNFAGPGRRRVENSSARAATASRCRIFSKKPGSSLYGRAA